MTITSGKKEKSIIKKVIVVGTRGERKRPSLRQRLIVRQRFAF